MAANMKIPEEEKLKLSRYIKAKVQEEGETVKSVVEKMNGLYKDRTEYLPGTINQINAANMTFISYIVISKIYNFSCKYGCFICAHVGIK